MKARCPKCKTVFEYPYEDRINVVLFGNWKKYHQCKTDVCHGNATLLKVAQVTLFEVNGKGEVNA